MAVKIPEWLLREGNCSALDKRKNCNFISEERGGEGKEKTSQLNGATVELGRGEVLRSREV